MPRFLHTADWQLGLRLNYVAGDSGASLRRQRFQTVERIAEVAHDKQAEVVLVAGDVFDANSVGNDTIQLALDALQSFGDIPVVLLPGNHDPGTPDSALARLGSKNSNLMIALTTDPIIFGDLEIYPCPLVSRHTYDDPTRHLPSRESKEKVRVALAHGGVINFSEEGVTANYIDADNVISKGFDYLALGDWHGLYRYNERVWYPGTPEATRFKERRPGFVLLVDIEAPGISPSVEEFEVQQTRWLQQEFEFLEDAEINKLECWFNELERPSATLVELTLLGTLTLLGRARLEELLNEYSERLPYMRIRSEQITDYPTEDDWGSFTQDGLLQPALAVLQLKSDPVDQDALRLLYRLLKEQE